MFAQIGCRSLDERAEAKALQARCEGRAQKAVHQFDGGWIRNCDQQRNICGEEKFESGRLRTGAKIDDDPIRGQLPQLTRQRAHRR